MIFSDARSPDASAKRTLAQRPVPAQNFILVVMKDLIIQGMPPVKPDQHADAGYGSIEDQQSLLIPPGGTAARSDAPDNTSSSSARGFKILTDWPESN